MKIRSKPKLVAGLLIAGTAILVGGGVLTASWPASGGRTAVAAVAGSSSAADRSSGGSSPSAATSGSVDSTSATPVASAPAPVTVAVPQALPTTPVMPSVSASFTYTVKPGDTLSGIAEWFKLHGYGDLYTANAGVIGADPNLIRPGERITVAGGVWTLAPPA
jgi:nucleoid-associated protein YgaU